MDKALQFYIRLASEDVNDDEAVQSNADRQTLQATTRLLLYCMTMEIIGTPQILAFIF